MAKKWQKTLKRQWQGTHSYRIISWHCQIGQLRYLVQSFKYKSTPPPQAANLPHQDTPPLSLGRSSLAPGRSGNQWSPRDPEASAAESSAPLLKDKREIFMSLLKYIAFHAVPRQKNKWQWKKIPGGRRSKHISKQISLTSPFLI